MEHNNDVNPKKIICQFDPSYSYRLHDLISIKEFKFGVTIKVNS